MPRTGKGGKRQGTAQTAYANRTDLNNRGPQPITTAPGQPYGQAQMQEDAQKAVPMSATPAPAPQATQAVSGPQNASQAPIVPMQPSPAPGEIPFDHPTSRPDEPIMAGTDSYAQQAQGNPHANLLNALERAASMPTATPRVKMLAEIARTAFVQ